MQFTTIPKNPFEIFYRVLVKYFAIFNRAILWFILSKKVHINMCPKWLSFRNKKFKCVVIICLFERNIASISQKLVKSRKIKTGFSSSDKIKQLDELLKMSTLRHDLLFKD